MNQPLPLFYRDLTPVDNALHGKLRFPDPAPDYRFAAATNIIPLLLTECLSAARHYPLVFAPNDEGKAPTLAAVVGLGDNVNRFVDAEGTWRAGSYLPAWVRRYPFFPVQVAGREGTVLAIDPQAEWLKADGGEPFLDEEGNPTERFNRIIAFNREFQAIGQRTEAVAKALLDAGVLEPGTLQIAPPEGSGEESSQVGGFLIVSEQKLRSLPEAQVLKLHRADAFGLAYAQLLSLGSVGNLFTADAADAAEREAAESPKH